MSNFLNEIKSAKLRKSNQPTKDYSDPKLAGFLTKSEITSYQNNVLDCNVENWYSRLKECTFESRFCEIEFEEAQLFIRIYETCFLKPEMAAAFESNWKEKLQENDLAMLLKLEKRLELVVHDFLMDRPFFIKTSCRSAKDSPLVSENFKKIYAKFLNQDSTTDDENFKITCLLRAAFESLKVDNAQQAIEMLVKSERIYQDMLLAVEVKDRFKESLIIREFVDIDVDMEFRGFVFDGKLTALSQYNYLIYSKRLAENKSLIEKKILEYFYDKVAPKLEGFLKNYVIDFALISSKL
jgi:hypothetical protein